MVFIDIFALIIALVFIYLFITQIITPVIKGTVLFPMFRKEQKLLKEKSEVLQKVNEKKIESEIETLKKKEGV
jgi:hypothetical protein